MSILIFVIDVAIQMRKMLHTHIYIYISSKAMKAMFKIQYYKHFISKKTMLILKAYKTMHHFCNSYIAQLQASAALTRGLIWVLPFCFLYRHLFMVEEITISSIMLAKRILTQCKVAFPDPDASQ